MICHLMRPNPLEDANDAIWIGTRSGLAVIRNQNVLKPVALNSFRGDVINIDTKSQENKIVLGSQMGKFIHLTFF